MCQIACRVKLNYDTYLHVKYWSCALNISRAITFNIEAVAQVSEAFSMLKKGLYF